MQKKQITILPKGLQRDTAVNVFSSDFAYDMQNIRITTNESNSFMCITNEKSNKEETLYSKYGVAVVPYDLSGIILGVQYLDDYIIVFRTTEATSSSKDYISKIYQEDSTLYVKDLYIGNLNFESSCPIETLGIHETDTIQKVYWLDGRNPARVINTSEEGIKYIRGNDDNQFDFSSTIPNSSINVSISKDYTSGNFPSGVVQYVMAYFNKYGKQSNIIYQSDLLYTSALNRGGSPEESLSNTFILDINNYSTNFSYLRIYRIIYTSIDNHYVERLPDIKLLSDGSDIKVYDTGTTGITVDPTELLYLGGKDFIANTFTHKDNVLFLGNLEVPNDSINNILKNNIKDTSTLEFILKEQPNYLDLQESLNTQYYYKSNLDNKSSNITFFQAGETYRFGVQFLTSKGVWSEVIYLGDKRNDKRVVPCTYIDGISKRPLLQATIPIKGLKDQYPDFIAARLVCVYPDDLNREVICQGITIPTLYNTINRVDNTPFAQSSWFARPDYILDDYDTEVSPWNNGNYSKMFIKRNSLLGFPLEYRMFTQKRKVDEETGNDYYINTVVNLPSYTQYNSEVQYTKGITDFDLQTNINSNKNTVIKELNENALYNNFGIDRSIVTFHSPEIDPNYAGFSQTSLDNVKFRVVGYIPVKTNFSDVEIFVDNLYDPDAKFLNPRLSDKSTYGKILNSNSLSSFPMWFDTVSFGENSTGTETNNGEALYAAFAVYPWHRKGSLNNQGKRDSGRKSVLQKKIMSNFRVTLNPRYLENPYEQLDISNVEIFDSNEVTVKQLNTEWESNSIINYYGNIDTIFNANSMEDGFSICVGARERAAYTPIEEDLLKGYGESYISAAVSAVGVADGCYFGVANYAVSGDSSMADSESYSLDPLPIQYRSTPHAVFAFKQLMGEYSLLPMFEVEKVNYDVTCYFEIRKEQIGIGNTSYGEGEIFKLNKGLFVGSTGSPAHTGVATMTIRPFVGEAQGKVVSVQFFVDKDWIEVGEEGEGSGFLPSMYIDDTLFMHCIETNLSEGESLDPYYGFNKTYTVDNPLPSLTLSIGSSTNRWANIFTKIIVKVQFNKDIFDNNLSYEDIILDFKDYKSRNYIDTTVEIFDGNNIYSDKISGTYDSSSYASDYYKSFHKNTYNHVFWEEPGKSSTFTQKVIEIPSEYNTKSTALYNSCYVLGELYREVNNKFGGDSSTALANNKWLPCSDVVYFEEGNESINILATQGDTYLQRYDHLKTYPYSEESVNNIVDIVSFCCETRINIDGRYDKNRKLESHLHIRPTNFNLYNKVYSQQNNYFTYNYFEDDGFTSSKLPSQITWSKTKVLGEEIDSWTNLNLANILDLDGDKGPVQKLVKFKDNIYSIQDKGISIINFNSRVQIASSEGVPIEIANSGKIDGKRYITEHYGCQNKWAITDTPAGIYFLDSINKSIMAFDGENFTDLTFTNKMSSWLNSKAFSGIWDPKNYRSCRVLYDVYNKDVYFTDNVEALAFNEVTGTFTSRYSYGGVGWLCNWNNITYQIKPTGDKKIWKLHKGGNYGTFFDTKSNYSISLIANPEFLSDKIFDTVEFRTNDVFTETKPFDTLRTENEYQEAEVSSSTLKKKFRIWRWPIGRNKKAGTFTLDRIRNPWTKIKLEGSSNSKIQLYDTSIIYYT